MNSLIFSQYLPRILMAGLLVMGISPSSMAQETQAPEELEAVATDASVLIAGLNAKENTKTTAITFDDAYRINPNFRISYQSYGQAGIVALQALVPLRQTVGRNITFLEGGYNINTEGDDGLNILVGHRRVSVAQDHLWGGYLGFYNQDVDFANFSQLIAGIERRGNLDVLLDGFIGLGDRTATRTTTTGTQTLGAAQGVTLNLRPVLSRINDTGSLRGSIGAYYLDFPDSGSLLGGLIGLDLELDDNFEVGVGLRTDEEFGTNFTFRLAATFPGYRPKTIDHHPVRTKSLIAQNGQSETNSFNPLGGWGMADRFWLPLIPTMQAQSTTTSTNETTGETNGGTTNEEIGYCYVLQPVMGWQYGYTKSQCESGEWSLADPNK